MLPRLLRSAAVALSLVGATFVVATSAHAQSAVAPKRWAFSLRAGTSTPVGSEADGTSTGFGLGFAAARRMADSRWSLRGDVEVVDHPFDKAMTGGEEVRWQMTGVGLLAQYDVPATGRVAPLVFGGVTTNRLSLSGGGTTVSSDKNYTGYVAGAGLRMKVGTHSWSVEAAYRTAVNGSDQLHWVPVTVGFTF
jgi:hypothetical protein